MKTPAAYDIMKKARATDRPSGREFIQNLCSEFIELSGDRRYGDDHAIIGGIGRINGRAITIIANEKGADINERAMRHFGSAHPEGYRKSLRLMKQAEKFKRPVLCLIDTAGAYCGIGAEERGEAQSIAENLMEMMTLRVPIISVLLGEGGSGGALALSVANEVWMMQNSIFSVISPEGCSSILWKTSDRVKEACEALKITPSNLLEMGIIENIIPEDTDVSFYELLKSQLTKKFDELSVLSSDDLCEKRYHRFRNIGKFQEGLVTL